MCVCLSADCVCLFMGMCVGDEFVGVHLCGMWCVCACGVWVGGWLDGRMRLCACVCVSVC